MNTELTIATTSNATLTMSSREIAELTGKRHDHVIVDIRKMLDGLGLHSPDFSGQYIDPTGRTLPCFNLPKRETMILVSGYSIPLRARIIDRWMELEAAAAQPQPVTPAIPQTYVEALRFAADEMERRLLAEDKARELEGPAAIGVITGRRSRKLKDVAQLLPHLNTNQIGNDLCRAGFLRRDTTDILYPVGQFRDTHFYKQDVERNGRAVTQIMVGPKGYETLAKLYLSGRLTMKVGYALAWRDYGSVQIRQLLGLTN